MSKLAELARFAELQLESKDIDPAYDTLRYLEEGMSREQALWMTCLYVGYYNLASAWQVFKAFPEPAEIPAELALLPTGVERRNLRGGVNLQRHVHSLLSFRRLDGFVAWLTEGFDADPQANWRRVRGTLEQPWGNGRWASYKTGELLLRVHGYHLRPTDMGNEFSSGPRKGLALFFDRLPEGNSVWALERLDELGEELAHRLDQEHRVYVGIEQLETLLCDFYSMTKGRYSVGHDIDMMQEQLLASKRPDLMGELWHAREAALPKAYLGELNGWRGVDKGRDKAYATRRAIDGR